MCQQRCKLPIQRLLEVLMEGLGVMGFVFGLLGVVAFVRLEKLTKELKAKGILDEDYREE
jgi:hypothetical protein